MSNELDFGDANILITGGLGFICSSLAPRLMQFGARVTLLDSLIQQYGSNLFNIHIIKGTVSAAECLLFSCQPQMSCRDIAYVIEVINEYK